MYRSYDKLVAAKHVAIVGAGPVGIEIAGEILHYHPEKQITLIYSGKHMLERCCQGAHKHLHKFFQNFPNVKIMNDQRVIDSRGDMLITDQGEEIKVSMVYCCVGFTPVTEYLLQNFGHCVTESGYVKVNRMMQMQGYDHIFVMGDIVQIAEEKLAQVLYSTSILSILSILSLYSLYSLYSTSLLSYHTIHTQQP